MIATDDANRPCQCFSVCSVSWRVGRLDRIESSGASTSCTKIVMADVIAVKW